MNVGAVKLGLADFIFFASHVGKSAFSIES
jgi:hypothetical protein